MSKNYLIIGGSSGIGLSLARQLATENNIIVASRSWNHGNLKNIQHVTYDVTGDDSLNLEVEHIDGLAYCPGTINLKPFHRLKIIDFQKDLEINLLGAVKTIQSVLPLLKKAGQSSVVMFSTVAVNQGMGFHASVATAKGAVEGLGKSLAAELAPKVRVNIIAPSITDTPLAGKLLSSEEKIQASAKRHPLNKVGTSEDIANMAAFLLSDRSSWITGQILGVDGGLSTIKPL